MELSPQDDPQQQRRIIKRQFKAEVDIYNHTARLGARQYRLDRINELLDGYIDLGLIEEHRETVENL